jgi:hypothetical protein
VHLTLSYDAHLMNTSTYFKRNTPQSQLFSCRVTWYRAVEGGGGGEEGQQTQRRGVMRRFHTVTNQQVASKHTFGEITGIEARLTAGFKGFRCRYSHERYLQSNSQDNETRRQHWCAGKRTHHLARGFQARTVNGRG